MLAALLLIGLHARRLPEPSEGPVVELRLVETKGPNAPVPGQKVAPSTPPASPAAPATERKTSPSSPAPAPPPQAEKSSSAPSSDAAPRPPAAPAAAPPPAPAEAPHFEMNLGGGDSLTNAVAHGPGIVQAKADSRYHNRQPVYPRAAALRGEQGTVVLLIHVGPGGDVSGVDIAQSSGFAALDRAAQSAVETWHYLPALRDGVPIPSEMALKVVFQLD